MILSKFEAQLSCRSLIWFAHQNTVMKIQKNTTVCFDMFRHVSTCLDINMSKHVDGPCCDISIVDMFRHVCVETCRRFPAVRLFFFHFYFLQSDFRVDCICVCFLSLCVRALITVLILWICLNSSRHALIIDLLNYAHLYTCACSYMFILSGLPLILIISGLPLHAP